MSVAAKVALHKQKHPEKYCPYPRCLWMTKDGSYCPRHRQSEGFQKMMRDFKSSEKVED